jgi:hypothetical protein
MRRSGLGRRIDERPIELEAESSAEIARQISRVGCYAFLSIRELWYLTNSSLSSGEPLSAKTVWARLTASPPISLLFSLSTTGRPHVLPTRALTSRAAPSSSPALPATPFTRNPVFRGACDKIHALATSPLESETKSARPPNPRPSVGEGTATAAYSEGFRRGADHARDHSSHQGTS